MFAYIDNSLCFTYGNLMLVGHEVDVVEVYFVKTFDAVVIFINFKRFCWFSTDADVFD